MSHALSSSTSSLSSLSNYNLSSPDFSQTSSALVTVFLCDVIFPIEASCIDDNWLKELQNLLKKDEISKDDIKLHLENKEVIEKWLNKYEYAFIQKDLDFYASLVAIPTLLEREKGDLDCILCEFTDPLKKIKSLQLMDLTLTPKHLDLLKIFVKLKTLELVRCKFQELSLQKIKDTLPDCKVEIA